MPWQVAVQETAETQGRSQGPCEDGGADGRDVATSPGTPGATRRWRRRGAECARTPAGMPGFRTQGLQACKRTHSDVFSCPAAPGTDASHFFKSNQIQKGIISGTWCKEHSAPQPLPRPFPRQLPGKVRVERKQKQVRHQEAHVPPGPPKPVNIHSPKQRVGKEGDTGGRPGGVILSGNRPLQVSLVKIKCSHMGSGCGQTHGERPCDCGGRDWGYEATSLDHLQPQTLEEVGRTLP